MWGDALSTARPGKNPRGWRTEAAGDWPDGTCRRGGAVYISRVRQRARQTGAAAAW